MKKIICVHLLNDYSGSPLVLSEAIKGFVKEGHCVELYTSSHTQGFLSNLSGVVYHDANYRWSKFKLLTLFYLFISQFFLFFKLMRFRKEDVVIYINTILPFGAGLCGKLMGKEVIYHIHETSVKPLLFKKFLMFVIQRTASQLIYVSDYLRKEEFVFGKKSKTIYNALPEEFTMKSCSFVKEYEETKRILMLCSLKGYKGVNEFCQLASMLPAYQFTLILNSDRNSIDTYFRNTVIPNNLLIHAAQKDVHLFYQDADVVLNLSHPDQWVETFGMTVLEAMSYGLPVIIPPVGGISELVVEGFNGFKIDVRSLDFIKEQIEIVFSNKSFYNYLSSNAKMKSLDYSIHKFHAEVCAVIPS